MGTHRNAFLYEIIAKNDFSTHKKEKKNKNNYRIYIMERGAGKK